MNVKNQVNFVSSLAEQQIKVVLSFLRIIFTENKLKLKNHRIKTIWKGKKLIMIDHLIILMTQIQMR